MEVRLWHEFVRYVSLAVSLSIEFANSRMAPQKRSVSKKKFSATTSVGAARSIATYWKLDP